MKCLPGFIPIEIFGVILSAVWRFNFIFNSNVKVILASPFSSKFKFLNQVIKTTGFEILSENIIFCWFFAETSICCFIKPMRWYFRDSYSITLSKSEQVPIGIDFRMNFFQRKYVKFEPRKAVLLKYLELHQLTRAI